MCNTQRRVSVSPTSTDSSRTTSLPKPQPPLLAQAQPRLLSAPWYAFLIPNDIPKYLPRHVYFSLLRSTAPRIVKRVLIPSMRNPSAHRQNRATSPAKTVSLHGPHTPQHPVSVEPRTSCAMVCAALHRAARAPHLGAGGARPSGRTAARLGGTHAVCLVGVAVPGSALTRSPTLRAVCIRLRRVYFIDNKF